MRHSAEPVRDVQEVLLRFHDPDGRRETLAVRLDDWQIGSGSLLPVRGLTTSGGRRLVQKMVPHAIGAAVPDEVYDLLENEVRVGVRLARCYRAAYPPELARLVGYDIDGELPFVLFDAPGGEPLATTAGDLLPEAQRRFQVSLLRGVLALSTVGVVHGHLDPVTVRFDNTTVHIGDYARAAIGREWRAADGEPGWAAPEQRTAAGWAHVSADVWSAGALIYFAVTGQRPPAAGASNLAHRGEALRRLLDGVFDHTPENRPTAAALLQRLRIDPTVPRVEPFADAAFDRGVTAFSHLLEQKRASIAPPPTHAPVVAPAQRPWYRRAGGSGDRPRRKR
jgi:hypothetical protein